jgi:hypothetical protein
VFCKMSWTWKKARYRNEYLFSVCARACPLSFENVHGMRKRPKIPHSMHVLFCATPRSSLVIAFPGGTGGGVHDINTYFD